MTDFTVEHNHDGTTETFALFSLSEATNLFNRYARTSGETTIWANNGGDTMMLDSHYNDGAVEAMFDSRRK